MNYSSLLTNFRFFKHKNFISSLSKYFVFFTRKNFMMIEFFFYDNNI